MNFLVPLTLGAIVGIFWAIRVPVEMGLYTVVWAFCQAFIVVFVVALFVSFLISIFFSRQ